MKWNKWLENWDMTGLKINISFLEMEWAPQEADREAAWDLYIELLTRVTTQPLAGHEGDEKAALESIHKLFKLTRSTLKSHGRDCVEFTKIAVIVLNQIVRPFTAKWHRLALEGEIENQPYRDEFRKELAQLQLQLHTYTRMLADMAGVEDLTAL